MIRELRNCFRSSGRASLRRASLTSISAKSTCASGSVELIPVKLQDAIPPSIVYLSKFHYQRDAWNPTSAAAKCPRLIEFSITY
jgi:hypothetical protein